MRIPSHPPRKPVYEGTNRAFMAIGAHADDIELNVGGTILTCFKLGYEVD